MGKASTTLSMRGVANLPGLQISLSRVTRRTFGIGLTGTKMGWFRVATIVIISLVFTAPFVASCIVLRNSSAANFKFLKVSKIHVMKCEDILHLIQNHLYGDF